MVRPSGGHGNRRKQLPGHLRDRASGLCDANRPESKEQQTLGSTSQISSYDGQVPDLRRRTSLLRILLFFQQEQQYGPGNSTLSNGLSSNYRFSSIFATSGRFAWETGEQANEQESAYIYNASLIATPLPTLTDSLVLSGRDETIGGKPQNTQSLFLNNAAQLYKGLDMNLNVGRTIATETDGSKLQSNTVTMGANVVPHRTMTWTFSYSYGNTDRSAPGAPSTSTLTRQETVTCAYTPFKTMYLFASVQRIEQTGQTVMTLQNYGFNWSPFPDGALQFRFSYYETVTLEPAVKQDHLPRREIQNKRAHFLRPVVSVD